LNPLFAELLTADKELGLSILEKAKGYYHPVVYQGIWDMYHPKN